MSRRTQPARLTLAAIALIVAAPAAVASASDDQGGRDARLVGRAVLPVNTYAPGPPSGAFVIPGAGVRNGITFPLASQPVEGFSAIIEGRRSGEYLAMPDNGFGSKAGSVDFNIRGYYVQLDFKTGRGGDGGVRVDVEHPIEFSDPRGLIGFPIVNEGSDTRVLTGGDIDPESLQRGRDGDLWVGDEFGPWLLHFDSTGRLLEAPFAMPDDLIGPANPTNTDPTKVNVGNSRGIEAMAMTPNGSYLYLILEGTVIGDPVSSRRVYEFDVSQRSFTAEMTSYRAELDADGVDRHYIADAQAIDRNRLLVIERDGAQTGIPYEAAFRKVFEVDLGDVADDGYLRKTEVVDLMAVADPKGVSLPEIHPGDVGIGDPFTVRCESIEALRILSDRRLLLVCDNNFPNTGRNRGLADDNEFITVEVPRL